MVCEHLVNIYEVTGDKTKLGQVVSDIESIEAEHADNEHYWEILGGVYSRANQTDRAERAYKKADEAKARKK